jgi:hypothetical protein
MSTPPAGRIGWPLGGSKVQFRVSFDDQVFAAFIEKIAARANGGSLNKAFQAMVIEWNALEDDRKLSNSCQIPVNSQSIREADENQLNDEQAELDDAW